MLTLVTNRLVFRYMTKLKIGDRVNKLVIIARVKVEDSWRGTWFRVRCDCGTVKEIRSSGLNAGKTKSCGCVKRELARTKRLNKSRFGPEHVGKMTVMQKYHQRASDIGVDFTFTREQFFKITSEQCFYCGRSPESLQKRLYKGRVTGSCTYNGIDRIDNLKGYTPDNCVACCWTCNRTKGPLSKSEFFSLIAAIVKQNPSVCQSEPTLPAFCHPRNQK